MIIEIIITLFLAFVLFYWHTTKYYDHFKNYGIAHLEPKFPFGNWNNHFLAGAIRRQTMLEDYKKFKVTLQMSVVLDLALLYHAPFFSRRRNIMALSCSDNQP